MIKKYLKRIFRSIGYDIVKKEKLLSFELSILKWLAKENVDVVIDVGANDGQYVKKIRNMGYEGKVISFEPTSEAYEKLVKNSENDQHWFVAPRMAIGEKNGEIEIFVSHNSVSSSILNILPTHVNLKKDSAYKNKETVNIRTLDSLFGNRIPKSKNLFLKIDTQGYEMKVLAGIEKNLEKVKGIQIELSINSLYEGQELYLEYFVFMEKNNFSLYSIRPGFMDKVTQQIFQFDGFFIRRKSYAF